MPGDSPVLHTSGRILFCGSLPGFLGAQTIIAPGLPAEVAGVQILVPLSWSLSFSAFSG